VLKLNRIVVYTDLAPASAVALRAAHALARASHASIAVLRVVAEPLAADWTSEVATARLPAIQGAMEDEVREWLDTTMGEVETIGIGLAVETGDPAAEIVRHVGTERPDLLVLAAPTGDADAAAVAQAIVSAAPCAVLVVRAGSLASGA
jgi:nucleotide-binding universal stress UspA family protein